MARMRMLHGQRRQIGLSHDTGQKPMTKGLIMRSKAFRPLGDILSTVS